MFTFFDKLSLNLNNTPLSKSIKKLVFIVWLIPSILISFLTLNILTRTLIKKEIENAQSNFELTQKNISELINSIQNIIDRDFLNTQFLNLFEDLNQNNSSKDYTASDFFNDYFKGIPEILNYQIYVDDESYIDNLYVFNTPEKIKREEWYNVAVRLRGKTFWEYITDYQNDQNYLCLIKSLWSKNKERFLGVLVVNVDPEVLKTRISSQFYQSILYFNSKVICSTISAEDLKLQNNKIKNILQTYDFYDQKIYMIDIKSKKHGILAYKLFPENTINLNFILVFLFPIRNIVELSFRTLSMFFIILFTLALLTFLVMRIYSSYIDGRVNKIQTGIKSVVSNNFAIAPTIGGNDEFEDIYHSLYEMSNNIKNLVNKIYSQSLEKEQLTSRQNEIRFKMLSTQINPHFLFNTLETIRMKAVTVGDKDVSVMLKQLAVLLRYNLNITGKPVSFYDELNAVQNYLAIQHTRFGQRISHDIVVLCNINEILVLPLLIQPIVENSFSHGLENTAKNGFIYILCEIVKDSNGKDILKISISDNGCGIEKNMLYDLQQRLELKEDEAKSIGIFNVNSRIKLFYGQEYGLSIKSEEGKGTTVTLQFPVTYKKDQTLINSGV